MEQRAGVVEITYLIANYNCGEYIRECLESLQQQTRPDWRALIVDDASSDASLEIIRPLLSEKIRLLLNEQNLGYVATLRRLIDNAPTDIVGILDADDALSPRATEAILRAYETYPGAGFVYSRFGIFDERLEVCRRLSGSRIPPHRTSLEEGFASHLKTFRRSVYRRTEGLDDSMLYAEDRDLVYKLEEVTTPVFVDEVLYKYRDVRRSQSREPAKRETGARNHLRARRRALKRRQVSRLNRLYHSLVFQSDYICYSDHYPVYLQRPIGVIVKLLEGIDRYLHIRRPGTLRRGDPLPEPQPVSARASE
ncbi:hypothetical protein BH23GEM9_BH23GEM9_29160 [soil metagenome]